MVKEIDKETQKVYKEGEKAYYLVKSEDWQWAKKKLLRKLSNLDSVRTLNKKEDLNQQIKVRNLAIDMILEWLDEIEGTAQQHSEQNKELLKKVEEEDYILNTEEE